MNRTIRNWTNATELEVHTSHAKDDLPAIVLITADSGPLRLHFGMNVEQVRDMAEALLAAANEIEASQVAA